jgi:hypothetical protein
VGAAGLKYTVQEEEAPAMKVVGLQVNNDIVPLPTEEEIVMDADFVTEPAEALMTTVWAGVELVVVAVNWAEVPFAATVTVAGTVTPVAVVDTLTAKPPLAAAELIDAVHVEEAPGAMLLGLHVKFERAGAVRGIEAVFDDPL